MKLEFILRLLDNDELNLVQVNDVKDFIDDYVERNQVLVILTNMISTTPTHVLYYILQFQIYKSMQTII